MKSHNLQGVLIATLVFITGYCHAQNTTTEDTKSTDGPLAAAEPSTQPAIYGQGVRDSSWQSPEKELAGFHLAAGFEARLFASEPMIAKPMNMAFDHRGRLWITQTMEYPYAAKEGAATRDAVMILEDTDGDGRADQATQFADDLNIPIGLLPYGDGCICFSIPNLLYLRDTDGDGICDQRQVILGPFDTTRDTHGMINALREGGDGWIYACHGFNNQSQVTGSDGHQVTMNSGNTFRFRPDGSRIEHVTHGQVNPFGMTTDEWGYRYTADCHSKPITQLIFGACYPSFGRPHDGLGFLPPMLEHLHGSTAICGIVSYPSDSAIPLLRNQMLSGNVMTSRINRNQVHYQGATAKGTELPDFMTSDDPWFRPVDLRVGLDGHLYIADFYNKIIGHYEVPLDHPDRDRDSGRIWQIRYTGKTFIDRARVANADLRFTKDGTSQQIQTLSRRLTSGSISSAELTSLIKTASPQVSVAAMRIARELLESQQESEKKLWPTIKEQLMHENPHIVQVAAETIGQHASAADIPLLLGRLEQTHPSDVVLQQTLRIAIRNLFQKADSKDPAWKIPSSQTLASIFLGLNRKEATHGLLDYLEKTPNSSESTEMLSHAVKLASQVDLDRCIRVADKLTQDAIHQRDALINELLESVDSSTIPAALRNWIARHVQERLQLIEGQQRVGSWAVSGGGIWPLQTRSKQGGGEITVASSIGRGESYVGNRTSDSFAAPKQLAFWVAGHNGFPDQESHKKNRVQLVRTSDSVILREALPPRSDVAIPIQWDLTEHQDEIVQLRVVDGDQADAYAWLGVGGFEPTWLNDSEPARWLRAALILIRRVNLTESSEQLASLITSNSLSSPLRFSAASTLATLLNQRSAATLLDYASELELPDSTTTAMLTTSFARGEVTLDPFAKQVFERLTQTQQVALTREWISSGAPLDPLLRFCEKGMLSPAVLTKPEIIQTLEPRFDTASRQRHRTLTHLLNVDQQLDGKLKELRESVHLSDVNLGRGKTLFTQHCANCHQLAGEGQVVGPQLDGAVSRTVERLLEDIVTPNRNVDQAFRTTSLLLDDGRVATGLVSQEGDQQISLIDASGKSTQIAVNRIVDRRNSGQSLMPNNFAELLKPNDFQDVIGYIKATPRR